MAKIVDTIRLAADFVIFRDAKHRALMMLVSNTITFQEYNMVLSEIEAWMNAMQFRYIDKHKVMELDVARKEFELMPEDLAKFNYN